MAELLLVVAITLMALAVQRLGELLRRQNRDEFAYTQLESRLEGQVGRTAASLASLAGSVLRLWHAAGVSRSPLPSPGLLGWSAWGS